MKRKFRLTRSKDFTRVRQQGKSYAHRFIVLIACPSERAQSRIGVLTSRGIRKAVQRNRSKRLIREVMRHYLPNIKPGWDIVLIARHPTAEASYNDIQDEVCGLLRQANLINE